MTRFTSIVIACAIALVSVSAQVPTTSTCVINTPEGTPQVGKPYTVTFTGCSGDKTVQLRYGLPEDLKTAGKAACVHANMSSGSCTFTPTKAGDFAFSVQQDGATEESYSAFFKVAPAPETKAPAVPAGKGPQPEADMKPEAKGLAASPKEPAVPAVKGPQPVANMKPEAKGLAASPKEPAVPAGKGPQPVANMKPEVKRLVASPKEPAVPAGKGPQPVANMKPGVKRLVASPKEPTVPAVKGPQPVADMKPKADGLPASPKGPAVPAAKKSQPMTSGKPKVKMTPSSSKAEAARKANTKRALYDYASFAL
ncbi:hypothetical protein CPB97_001881 [Podila verticillata]|nr:hypothetical protein CPB97_001881 [Podila verticillata]